MIMSGEQMFAYFFGAAICASFLSGIFIRSRRLARSIAVVLGVMVFGVRVKYDSDPAMCEGSVGWPLLCLALSWLGGSVRRVAPKD